MTTYSPQLRTNNTTIAQKSEVMFTVLIGMLVSLFCFLSLIYLSHANSVATKGYTIKQLQEQKASLQAEVDLWNLKLVRLQALGQLESSEKFLSMLDYVDAPSFINLDNQFAQR